MGRSQTAKLACLRGDRGLRPGETTSKGQSFDLLASITAVHPVVPVDGEGRIGGVEMKGRRPS